MAVTDIIKRAPNWAWIASAGVAGGAALIYTLNHRAAAVKPDATTDAQPDYVGTDNGYGVPSDMGSPAGTIISPPVVVSGGQNDSVGYAQLQDTYLTGVQQLLGNFQDQADNIATVIYSSVRQGADIYGEGVSAGAGASQGGASQLAGLLNIGGGAAAAPAPAGAVAAPPSPAAAPATPPNPCSGHGAYQFFTPGRGCYKVVCASGKGDHAKGRWHFYENHQEFHVNGSC